MAKRIALFNHKGGVSKTTTAFHLGWMLAEMGHTVILVDADPQCNLSGLILGLSGEDEFDSFYQDENKQNIRTGLAPAFESRPAPIEAVECVPVAQRPGLFLLPGHIRLSEYEVTLGIAQELSGSIQTLQNLPGALSYLLDVTAAHHHADYVILDMNPSLSSLNQNALMTSDYFVVPTSPDYFSLMAIESLATVIPRWGNWSTRAQSLAALKEATYPFPNKSPKLLGTIIQKYRPRGGEPTAGFQQWITKINQHVETRLRPALEPLNMLLPAASYELVEGLLPSLCLALISDFNSLIAKSQTLRTPVFALSDEQLGSVGTVLQTDQIKRDEFRAAFAELSRRVTTLTADADAN